MVNLKLVLRGAALLVMSLWAQNAAALVCGSAAGSPGGNVAAELFANAKEDTCGSAIFSAGPTKAGHVFFASEFGVTVQFIVNGVLYTPSSKSLVCNGSLGNSVSSTAIRANFPSSVAYATVCTLTYTDQNNTNVTHTFGGGSQFLGGGALVGYLTPSTVTTGWFERISPTATLAGVSGTLPSGALAVTATFSERIASFGPADLSLINATVASITILPANAFSFNLVPIASGTFSAQLPANAITDLAGNGNTASNTISGTADFTAPSVGISGLPAQITGPTVFNATISFSENVTGFVASDITISGGAVTALTGSGAVYTAAVSVDGGSGVAMSIAAAVAQDGAGNDNTASATAISENVTPAQTGAAITHFMQTRANALLSNQPDLAGFLRGGHGQFAAEVTRGGGEVTFDSGYAAPIWARLNANWSTDLGAESQYIFGVIGGHSKLSGNFLLGGMLQFDHVSEVNGTAETSGTGWLIGPYFAAKLPNQPLYFEGSLLYGQTDNTISPLGTYTDRFSTERWLATLGVSGQMVRGNLTLIPFLDAKYTSDAQAAYIDGLGNPIAGQTIGLAQASAGLDFELALTAATALNGGVSGVWSYSSGSATEPGYEGGRARVDLGVTHQLSDCGALGLSGFYDGIGAADFESFGAEIKWEMCF